MRQIPIRMVGCAIARTSRQPSFLILSALILLDGLVFFHFPEPLGIDGYYYAVQLKLFNLTGHYPYSLRGGYWLYMLIPITKIFGPIATIKVAAIALDILMSVSLLQIARLLCQNLRYYAFSVVVLHLSGLYTYLLVEYVDQLAAQAFCTAAVCALFSARNRGKHRVGLYSASIIFGALAMASHRAGLPVICLLFAAGLSALVKSTSLRAVLVVLGVGVFALALSKIFPQDVGLLNPNRLGFMSLARLLALFSLIFYKPPKERHLPVLMRRAALILLVWIGFNPFLSYQRGMNGVSGRLLLILPEIIAVWGTCYLATSLRRKDFIPLGAGIIGLTFNTLFIIPFGTTLHFVATRHALAEAIMHLPPTAPTTYVARHGDEFLLTYYTSQPATHNARGVVGPCTWLVDWPSVIKQQQVEGRRLYLTRSYTSFLMTDAQLEQNLGNLNSSELGIVTGRNPAINDYLGLHGEEPWEDHRFQ